MPVMSHLLNTSAHTLHLWRNKTFIDKKMEVPDGVYLKGDHTFKIIKSISKINGQPVFTALYTVLNECEEVRLQFLVPTRTLSNLQCTFEAMRNAYDLYRYTQPQIFFTDNVTGDQHFLKNVLPSLSQDVVPFTEEEPQELLNVRRYQVHCWPSQTILKLINVFAVFSILKFVPPT